MKEEIICGDSIFHLCPDNMEMVKWIVNTWSKEEETVLDPFLGSGSTLLAAKMLKRNGIGIEMSQEYCDMSRKRIDSVSLLF